jgi:hypothetical protein
MWEENPSAWQLRMQYPSEARLLEDIVVADCLSSLGLLTTKYGGPKTTNFRIKLDNEYELQISPVDKGRDGYAEWFSWHQRNHQHSSDDCDVQMPESSIRANIKLFYSDENGRSEIYSFTHHHQDVETLIRSAFILIHRDLGFKLNPIVKRERGRSAKNKKFS